MSYSNDDPLLVVKGDGVYLIDEKGNRFLDTRNNVGHVGWQNEAVVRAVQEQIMSCNVNTRYLHPSQTKLAKKLTGYFEEALATPGISTAVNSK